MPPIFAAFAAVSAFVATTLGVSATVGALITANILMLGLSIGVSAIEKALAPKPGLRGSSLQVSLSANDPRRILLSLTNTAGALFTFVTWGTNNANIALYFRVADHKCNALNAVLWGGNPVTLGAGGAVSQFNKDGKDNCWITFANGDWGQAADPDLIAHTAGRWTSADHGRGIAYVKVKALFNAKAFPGGINDLFQFVFTIAGASLYDRRLDSSVGGSGTQRFNDQSTWTLNANSAVVAENFLRGFRSEDTTVGVGSRTVDYFCGLRLTDSVLPFTDNVAAMNHCDESVSLKAGGTEKRYSLGGVVTADQGSDTILSDLLATMGGELMSGAGRYVILPAVTRTSVRTFLDTDLRLDGPFNYSQNTGLDTIANAVTGQFLDPAALYSAQPLPPRTSSADAATDGGSGAPSTKVDTLDLSYVTSFTQGQRVQEIHRRRSRRQRTATIAVGAANLDLEAGDWITWNSARFAAAWDGALTFEIVQTLPQATDKDDGDLMVVLTLTEVDSGVFAWTPSSDELSRTTPVNLSSAGPTPVSVTTLTAAVSTISSSGGVQPVLSVTRDAATDPTIVSIIYQYWAHGLPSGAAQVFTEQYAVNSAAESGTQSISLGAGKVVGGYQYDVQATYVCSPPADTNYCAVVTTSGTTAAAVSGAGPDSNRVPYSLFEGNAVGKPAKGWVDVFDPAGLVVTESIDVSGGVTYLKLAATATAGAQSFSYVSDLFPVSALEWLLASCRVITSANANMQIVVQFSDSTGTAIAGAFFRVGPTTIGASLTGALEQSAGVQQAPSNARFAQVQFYILSLAAGALSGEIGQPMVSGANAGQTAFPGFNAGPGYDPGADPTILNTAAAIVGQAPAATDPTVQSGSTPNQPFVQEGDPTTIQNGVSGTYVVLDGALWFKPSTQTKYMRFNGAWVTVSAGTPGASGSLLWTSAIVGSQTFTIPTTGHIDIIQNALGGNGFVAAGKTPVFSGASGGSMAFVSNLSVTAGDVFTVFNSGVLGTPSTLVCAARGISLSVPTGISATSGAAAAAPAAATGGTTNLAGHRGGIATLASGGGSPNAAGVYSDQNTANNPGTTPGGGGSGAGAGAPGATTFTVH